jgi:hypothetical protein
MTKRTYRANDFAHYGDVEAELIGELVESHGGQLTPQEFVEAAAPASSPLHRLFTWDDRKAANAHRLTQARAHLCCLQVEIISVTGEEQRTRAVHAVFVDAGGKTMRSYLEHDRIAKAPDLARQVIERAAQMVLSWRRRYDSYSSVFGPVFEAIDKLEETQWQPQRTGQRKSQKRKTVSRKSRPAARASRVTGRKS